MVTWRQWLTSFHRGGNLQIRPVGDREQASYLLPPRSSSTKSADIVSEVVGAVVLNGDLWTSLDSDTGWSGCICEGTGDSLQVSLKSRQGPWHITKTIASGVGMSNDW